LRLERREHLSPPKSGSVAEAASTSHSTLG
jgi:hypothetical protein